MFLRTKRIPYCEIRFVRQIPIGALRRWPLWGTTDPRRWFNLDVGRRHKSVGFVIDAGRRVKPVITPDHSRQVLTILRSYNVQISES